MSGRTYTQSPPLSVLPPRGSWLGIMGEGGPVVIVRWDPGVADGCLPVMFRALGIPGTEGMEHKGGQN